MFTVFAFVVLLGTVFPLIMEALDNRRTVVVGAPDFDRLSMPIGIALLFLMAVAPVLPWRKASQELLRDRLFWPAWCGVAPCSWRPSSPVRTVGRRWSHSRSPGSRPAPLRQLVLATRRQGWRGLVGRANGGMIVHIGVIVVAVALVASNAYTKSAEITLQAGVPVEWQGHTFELVDVTAEQTAWFCERRARQCAARRTGKVYGPAVTTYLRQGMQIGTPVASARGRPATCT